MSMLVNVETGEIAPAPLDRAEAERITTRIRLRLDAIADNYVAVMPLIREAIERGAWVALGYNGVSQYVSECFGDALQHLGVEVRREVVRELTDAGMSTRTIAEVVGVSHMTVQNDVNSGVKTFTPTPPTPAVEQVPEQPQGTTDTVGAESVTRPAPAPASTAGVTIGRDGKTYPRPQPAAPVQAEPAAPRRRPLADAFWTGVYEAEKRIESLHRLTQDDRWTQNAEKVAAKHRNDLHRINDLLQQVINSLPEKEATP